MGKCKILAKPESEFFERKPQFDVVCGNVKVCETYSKIDAEKAADAFDELMMCEIVI